MKPSKSMEALLGEVHKVLSTARSTVYTTANAEMVKAYWHIGRLIVEHEQAGQDRAAYGKELVKGLSQQLTADFGKGFDERNLRYMRQFYQVYSNWNAVRSELSWTHYRLLLKVENPDARAFYMQEAIEGRWSTRTLDRQINSLHYDRMLISSEKAPVKTEADRKVVPMQASDLIKDPYVLEFLDLKASASFYEKELEQAIIDKLQEFLLELGKGFSFVGRQYRLAAGPGKDFYADLVFYNYILKCFLIIDLKVGELTHQDIGQMDMYVRYFEDQIRQPDDNPTIGLILCSEKNKTVVKYSLLNESQQVFASKYQMYLPSEKELRQQINQERQQLEIEKGLGDDQDQ